MDKHYERKLMSILQVLQDNNKPMGSNLIAMNLQELGFNLSERMIRYYLQKLDQDGFTANIGKKGRVITHKGITELKSALIFEKVGFIASKIDTLAYKMNFSLKENAGTIILNITTFENHFLHKAFKEIASVFHSGFCMGKYLAIAYPDSTIGNIKIDPDKVAIGTVCSVTLNGILLKNKIYTASRFGGVLEISNGLPSRFTEIISYDSTSIDPLEIFIKGKMTNVTDVIRTGNGRIGAGFREFPSIALPKVKKIKKRLDDIGLGGILIIGKPGQPLLDIPVPDGRVGMIVAGGLNPIAAVEESGIPTENSALKLVYDFNRMIPFTNVQLD